MYKYIGSKEEMGRLENAYVDGSFSPFDESEKQADAPPKRKRSRKEGIYD